MLEEFKELIQAEKPHEILDYTFSRASSEARELILDDFIQLIGFLVLDASESFEERNNFKPYLKRESWESENEEIPDVIEYILEKCDIELRSIESPIDNLFNVLYLMPNLVILNIDHCKFLDLDKAVLSFVQLESLRLKDVGLVRFSGSFEELEELDLSCNLIDSFEDVVNEDLSASLLNLAKNKITGDIPSYFSEFSELSFLNVRNNQIEDISALDNLSGLTVLLEGNKNVSTKRKIGSFHNLFIDSDQLKLMNEILTVNELNIQNGNDSLSFKELSHLTELKYLSIQSVSCSSTKGLEKLASIEQFSFEQSNLKEIPKEIFDLKEMKKLSLSGNDILTVSMSDFGSRDMNRIDFSDNRITDFFLTLEEIESFPLLKEVVLTNNNLTSLPASIFSLPSLEEVYLEGNNFTVNEIEHLNEISGDVSLYF